jgi:hypothetical protein
MARLRACAFSGALAGVLWLVWGHGFANYDALYSLVWGRQIAHGHAPAFEVPLAPTPHPLANLLGIALAAVGPRTAETILVVIAFLALGAVGWLVFRLGERWFGRPAGALAALILLTREPVLSYGTRAYVDVPYLALVLGALLLVSRRPRAAGWPLALLALAGLIRPEAWLLSLAYLAWLWRTGGVGAEWVGLAASGPLLWFASDLVVTGNPLHSLTGTRANVETLGRVTGLQHVPVTLPRRLGEVLREPVLVGAAGGLVLVVAFLRDRARLLVGAGVVAFVAFCLLAAAGLPIITRYTFVMAALGAVLCGAGAFGWRELPREHPWRRRWMAFGVLTILLLAVFVPSQAHRLSATHASIADQQRIEADLWDVRIPARCGGLGVVNHRLVPLLALKERVSPAKIHAAPLPPSFRGRYVEPANAAVAKAFVLDPRDPSQRVAAPPPGLSPAGGNASWRVLARCPQDVFSHGGE